MDAFFTLTDMIIFLLLRKTSRWFSYSYSHCYKFRESIIFLTKYNSVFCSLLLESLTLMIYLSSNYIIKHLFLLCKEDSSYLEFHIHILLESFTLRHQITTLIKETSYLIRLDLVKEDFPTLSLTIVFFLLFARSFFPHQGS